MGGAVGRREKWLRISPAVVAVWFCVPVGRGAERSGGGGAGDSGLFNLQHADAYLDLRGDYRDSRVDSSRGASFGGDREQRNREWRLEEALGLSLAGSVVAPEFISYRAEVSFALTQNRFTEHGAVADRTESETGRLLLYDFRLNFLPGKKLSGSAYGQRRDDRVSRRFQPTLDERRTRLGTSWTWADHRFPMELSYDFSRTDRKGNRERRDDEEFVEHLLRYRVSWLINEHHRFKFSYEHSEREQEYQGLGQRFETTRDLFTIEHQLDFGAGHANSLRTLVHWQEETGAFARDLFEIGPQLIIKHSDSLQTLYKYQFKRERYFALDVETHRADYQLIHQWYENLTTTFTGFGLYEEIADEVNTTQYGASIDWQYNRKNRFGRLYANLALAYDTEDVSGDDGRRLVLDETHTFRDPVDLTLLNRNVVRSGMVVTDAANRRVFTPGVDYTVIRQGTVTRIGRISSGAIADGDTVLVDYQYDTPADGRLDTIRVDFSLEQRFSIGLTPYYRFSYRNQEDDSTLGFARRTDLTDHHRLGVNYDGKRFRLGAEYEVFDDTIEPYDAFHVNGLVHLIQSRDHSLDASTRISRLFFGGSPGGPGGGGDDRDVTLIDVTLDHRWRLGRALSTVGRLSYRLEEDSRDGTTQGWDATVGLEYAIGALTSSLTFEYDRLDLPRSEDEEFGVFIRVRRDFSNVLLHR